MAEATAAAVVDGNLAAVEEVKQQMEAVNLEDGEKGSGEEPAAKSKKALKKEQKAAEKAAKAAALAEQQQSMVVDDPLKDKYGDLPLVQSQTQSGRKWTQIEDLTSSLENQQVLIRGHVYTFRQPSGNLIFVTIREGQSTVQIMAQKRDGVISKQMIKFMADVPKESWVEILGKVQNPFEELKSTSQKVEIHVEEFRVISRADALPFDVIDAARNPNATEESGASGPTVKQDMRLDYRYMDLRTPANQAIFRIQAAVCQLFREYLMQNHFQEIHTPKLTAGSSEGGANVFSLQYFGRDCCLAQSPQLCKQMAVMSGFSRVFEIGPVFRAENSNTHRHLCEFTGLDFEMAIQEHYSEVMDVVEGIFFYMFEHLEKDYSKQIEIIDEQYEVQPLQYNASKPTRISFPEGIAMLRENGLEIGEYDDLNTEAERTLGRLVKEKFGTDFFIMYRFPLEIRPFYTMPDPENANYSNSFDVFIRGEEIISGAQRVHDPSLLLKMAERCGVSMKQEGVKDYVDSFRYGAKPHGGAGVGMERVVMLYLGLDNIRKTSMFPRDPKRLTP